VGSPAGAAGVRGRSRVPTSITLWQTPSRQDGKQNRSRRKEVASNGEDEEQCTVKKDGLKGASEEVEALKSFIKVPQSTDLYLKTTFFFHFNLF